MTQQRLEDLTKELDALPQESDSIKAVMVNTLKAMAKVLPIAAADGDKTEMGDTLDNAERTLNNAAGILGEGHLTVIILQKMLAIIRQEPTGAPPVSRTRDEGPPVSSTTEATCGDCGKKIEIPDNLAG